MPAAGSVRNKDVDEGMLVMSIRITFMSQRLTIFYYVSVLLFSYGYVCLG
jgi:hypothetical protein